MNMQPDITGLLPEGKAMTSRVTPFDFEGYEVRVMDRDGNPWWVWPDVCRVLGIANPSDAAASLDDDEKTSLDNPEGVPGFNGARSVTLINESGLYKKVLRSNKPRAKRFTKWVTRDVLPNLRKTGSYSLPSAQHPSLTTEDRSVVGGIIKRVIASQIRPLYQMQEMLKQEIAVIKAAPIRLPSPFERR
jgi:prophage antirepressor-like protein